MQRQHSGTVSTVGANLTDKDWMPAGPERMRLAGSLFRHPWRGTHPHYITSIANNDNPYNPHPFIGACGFGACHV
jgi:hypothetical protein